jgi:hypothetical protein
MIRARTPHAQLVWLRPRDVAADLGISRPTAASLIRRIPGAERLYAYEKRKGEVWRVRRDDYDRWRAAQESGAAGTA